MGHAFDTKAAKPQRTLIQQGAIALLAPLKRPAGYLVDVIAFGAVVRTYHDAGGVAMLIDAIAGRAPAVAISTGDRVLEPAGIGGFSIQSELELLVYFASSNARNQQIGRQEMDAAAIGSNAADPGLHVMMEHALELIIGQRCGGTTSIKQLRLVREEELATTVAVTLWLQTYRVTVTNTAPEWRTATQLLTSIGLGLAIDPLPGGPVPDPATIYADIAIPPS